MRGPGKNQVSPIFKTLLSLKKLRKIIITQIFQLFKTGHRRAT